MQPSAFIRMPYSLYSLSMDITNQHHSARERASGSYRRWVGGLRSAFGSAAYLRQHSGPQRWLGDGGVLCFRDGMS
jgi:hypothetical protein